jgi:hypothetical protein
MKLNQSLMLTVLLAPLTSLAQEPRTLACKLNLTTQAYGVTNTIDVLPAEAAMPTTLRQSDGVFTYQVSINRDGYATIDLSSTGGDRMFLQMSALGIRKGTEVIAGSTFGMRLKAPLAYRVRNGLTQVIAATVVCARNP